MRVRLHKIRVAGIATLDVIDMWPETVLVNVLLDRVDGVIADNGEGSAGCAPRANEFMAAMRRSGGPDGCDLTGGKAFFDTAGKIAGNCGGVEQDLVWIICDLVRRHWMTLTSKQFAELDGDRGRGKAGEDGADRAVEVEKEGSSPSEETPQGLVSAVAAPRHRAKSVLTVVHMLSNQVRAWSTYWEPVDESSSVTEWWKRMASLPIRS